MSLLALLDMLGMLHWIIYYNTAKYKQQVAQTLNAEIQCKLNNLFSHFKKICFIKIFIFQTAVWKIISVHLSHFQYQTWNHFTEEAFFSDKANKDEVSSWGGGLKHKPRLSSPT